jgi:putative membrane protein
MKICRWVAVFAATAVLLPSAILSQTDQNQAQPSGALGTAPSSGPMQPSDSSMRETLGAPGLTGRQMADRTFVRMAVEDGIADIALGQLAIQKGGPDVKTLAQTMVDDHTSANKQMAAVADSLGVLLPKKMNKDDQVEFDKLNGLSGKDFDTEYLTFILKAHWKHLHDFYMEASVASDPGLATQVAQALKTMHDHLGMISKVAATDGIALPPRPPRPPRPDGGSPPPPAEH